MQVIIKELGIDNQISADSTYECLPNTNKEALILSHSQAFLKNIPPKVNEVNQCLPSIYWIPKPDTNPRKARFIIHVPKSSLKPFSKSIIYGQIESYHTFDLWHKVILDNFKQLASDNFY